MPSHMLSLVMPIMIGSVEARAAAGLAPKDKTICECHCSSWTHRETCIPAITKSRIIIRVKSPAVDLQGLLLYLQALIWLAEVALFFFFFLVISLSSRIIHIEKKVLDLLSLTRPFGINTGLKDTFRDSCLNWMAASWLWSSKRGWYQSLPLPNKGYPACFQKQGTPCHLLRTSQFIKFFPSCLLSFIAQVFTFYCSVVTEMPQHATVQGACSPAALQEELLFPWLGNSEGHGWSPGVTAWPEIRLLVVVAFTWEHRASVSGPVWWYPSLFPAFSSSCVPPPFLYPFTSPDRLSASTYPLLPAQFLPKMSSIFSIVLLWEVNLTIQSWPWDLCDFPWERSLSLYSVSYFSNDGRILKFLICACQSTLLWQVRCYSRFRC